MNTWVPECIPWICDTTASICADVSWTGAPGST